MPWTLSVYSVAHKNEPKVLKKKKIIHCKSYTDTDELSKVPFTQILQNQTLIYIYSQSYGMISITAWETRLSGMSCPFRTQVCSSVSSSSSPSLPLGAVSAVKGQGICLPSHQLWPVHWWQRCLLLSILRVRHCNPIPALTALFLGPFNWLIKLNWVLI